MRRAKQRSLLIKRDFSVSSAKLNAALREPTQKEFTKFDGGTEGQFVVIRCNLNARDMAK